MVPMADVGLEVALEALEVAPVASPEELVLQVAEDLLGRAVVDAVAPARHALHEAVLPELRDVGRVLALPAHVGVQGGARALRLRRHEHGEHLLLLGEARALRDRPRHDLLAAEVVHGREVGLAEGALEPGDVGAHLLPGAVGGEVAAERVLEGLADLPPVGAVPVVVGLPADAAPEAHLAHHPEHRLVRYPRAVDGAQLHGHLPVSDAVREPAEDLGDPGAQLRPGRGLGMGQRVVVARPGEAGGPQEAGEVVPP